MSPTSQALLLLCLAVCCSLAAGSRLDVAALWRRASTKRIDQLTVASLNIRYAAAVSDEPSPPGHERPWSERVRPLTEQVEWTAPDIIGFQEVLHGQLRDLDRALGDVYAHVGVGRDDGKHAGEAVPIFYRRDLFSLIDVEHIWLSPTPHVPGSIGWDAVRSRRAPVSG